MRPTQQLLLLLGYPTSATTHLEKREPLLQVHRGEAGDGTSRRVTRTKPDDEMNAVDTRMMCTRRAAVVLARASNPLFEQRRECRLVLRRREHPLQHRGSNRLVRGAREVTSTHSARKVAYSKFHTYPHSRRVELCTERFRVRRHREFQDEIREKRFQAGVGARRVTRRPPTAQRAVPRDTQPSCPPLRQPLRTGRTATACVESAPPRAVRAPRGIPLASAPCRGCDLGAAAANRAKSTITAITRNDDAS